VVSTGEACLYDDQQNSKIALISLNFSETRAICRCVGLFPAYCFLIARKRFNEENQGGLKALLE
ncbi:hypothetical protein, partial [Enterococcus diestrammenae]